MHNACSSSWPHFTGYVFTITLSTLEWRSGAYGEAGERGFPFSSLSPLPLSPPVSSLPPFPPHLPISLAFAYLLHFCLAMPRRWMETGQGGRPGGGDQWRSRGRKESWRGVWPGRRQERGRLACWIGLFLLSPSLTQHSFSLHIWQAGDLFLCLFSSPHLSPVSFLSKYNNNVI